MHTPSHWVGLFIGVSGVCIYTVINKYNKVIC